MGKKLFLLCVAVLLLQASIFATPLSDIISGFDKGDTQKISAYLNDNVEMAIKGAENIFTRQQTTTVLADFFKKNEPKTFEVEHQGERNEQQYIIGNLYTKSGKFRVYFLIKNNLIQQLRIENSND